jgi:hypothetical protein
MGVIEKGGDIVQKKEKITVKREKEQTTISLVDIMENDITFENLPEDVRAYFKVFLEKVPRHLKTQRSHIELVQRLKNILTTGYLRDLLFQHITETKDRYKDSDNPEDWIHQVQPTMFTKLKQLVDTQSKEMVELFKDEGAFDDDMKLEEEMVMLFREREIFKRKQPDVIEAEYKIIGDDDGDEGDIRGDEDGTDNKDEVLPADG